MKNIHQGRRFPRKHIPKQAAAPDRPAHGVWIGRAIWFVAGSLLSASVAFLSQGPDAIRRIPDIPAAVRETVNSVIEAREIDQGLTGTWELQKGQGGSKANGSPIRLELTSENGRILGELNSPVVRKWTIYDMALVEGNRTGSQLHLTVFDFIYGKRTRLAELDVRFQEDSDGILDHTPALVHSELRIDTAWQKGNVLPRKFSVHRVSQ